MLRALLAVAFLAGSARADRDLCAPGTQHHGRTLDVDLVRADIHDAMRLLADVGHVNLVVSDDVQGKVTLRLQRVPWDAAACTIAALNHLTMTVQDNILIVSAARSRALRPADR